MDQLAQQLVNGLAWGSIYALIALGYTMVYGVLRLINFAHGDVYMVGAMCAFYFAHWLGFAAAPSLAGFGVVMLLAMIACALLGATIERVAYRPLRGRGKGALLRITPLVTALGMSVLLQNLAQLLFTARFRPYPQLLSGTYQLPVIGALSTSRVVILVVSVLVMVGLELIVTRTWFGKAMRALSANEEAARLMGIRTGRVISTTFALGSSLAETMVRAGAASAGRLIDLTHRGAARGAADGGVGHVISGHGHRSLPFEPLGGSADL